MKADLILKERILISENSICEMIIWRLPEKTKERPHGLKYRLHFGDINGNCFVRYDNEHGKGDHRHYNDIEEFYQFENVEKLIKDFIKDVEQAKRRQSI